MIQKEKDKPNNQSEENSCLSSLTSLLSARRYPVRKFHIKVGKEISKIIKRLPDGTTLVALESEGLPYGDITYIWIELSLTRSRLIHVTHKTDATNDIKVVGIQLSQEQSRVIIETLERYKIWKLPRIDSSIIDGFCCSIIIATHDKSHAFWMHLTGLPEYSAEHEYWQLINYLSGLSDLYANNQQQV